MPLMLKIASEGVGLSSGRRNLHPCTALAPTENWERCSSLISRAVTHRDSLVANTQTRQTRRRLCESAAHAKGIFAPHAVGCWIPAGVSCCEIKLNHLASSLLLGEVQLSRSAPVAEPIKWLDSCQCPRALLAAYILSPPVFGFFSLPLWQALMNLRD